MLISRHSFLFSLTSHSVVTWCHVYVNDTKLLPKMEVKDNYTSTGNCMFSRHVYSCTDVTEFLVSRHQNNTRNCRMLPDGSAFIYTKSFDGPMTRALLHYLFWYDDLEQGRGTYQPVAQCEGAGAEPLLALLRCCPPTDRHSYPH